MSVYIGIDWSEQKHQVVFLNEAGVIIGQLEMSHPPEGLLNLEKTRRHLGVSRGECLVALETAHNLVIDFLWAQAYPQIYVMPPSVIKSCRGRYGQSGARDDPRDGQLIADVLRPGRARPQPWRPDSLLTRQMRAKVSLINHLTRNTVRWSNRLRYYPAALTVFNGLKSQVALHFILTYPTPQAATALTWTEFEAFAHQHRYRHVKKLPACFARLQQAQPQASSETVLIYQEEAGLEDEVGLIDIILRPQVYAHYRRVLHTTSLIIVEGTVQREGEVINVLALRVANLSQSSSAYRSDQP